MTRQRTGSRALGGLGQGSPGRGGLMTLAFLSGQGPETVVAAHFGIPCRRGLVAAKAVLFGWRPFHATRWLAGGIIPSRRPLVGPCRGAALSQGVVQTRGTLSHRRFPLMAGWGQGPGRLSVDRPRSG